MHKLRECLILQTIHDGFQHEQPDYWLNFGNPWEIERLNIAYTIKFYGHVSVQEEGGRQTFRWNPGESVSPPPVHSSPQLAQIAVLRISLQMYVLNLQQHVNPPAAHFIS